jgi:HK97 family phage major capsid protein
MLVYRLVDMGVPAMSGSADFTVYARAIMLGRGDKFAALDAATATPNVSPRVASVIKAAISSGTTTSPSWSSLVDYQVLEGAFRESLRSTGTFDRMLADGAIRRVPLNATIVASSTAVVGKATGESQPKPVFMLSLTGEDLAVTKVAAILVLSSDLVRSTTTAAMAFISRELRAAIVAATDAAFIAIVSVGVTPVVAAGTDAAAVGTGIRTLLNAVDTSAGSALYLLMPPLIAKRVAGMTNADGSFAFPEMSPSGGSMAGIPVLVTDQMEADRVMLVDAAQLFGDAEPVVLDDTRHASLLLDDAPAPGAAAVTSLWQRDLYGLRGERSLSLAVVGDKAVALLDGVQWGSAP